MIQVPISLTSQADIAETFEALKLSVPFKQGELFSTESLQLINTSKQYYPCQFQVLASWPDGSVKWLLIHCYCLNEAQSPANEQLLLTDKQSCYTIASDLLANNKITITEQESQLKIDTGYACFLVDTKTLGTFSVAGEIEADKKTANENSGSIKRFLSNNLKNKNNKQSIVLTDNQGCEYFPKIAKVTINQGEELSEQLTATINFSGEFVNSKNEALLNFSATLTFYAGSGDNHWQFTLHNPKSMEHQGGKWDLGNSNSVLFQSVNIHLACEKLTQVDYKTTSQSAWQNATGNTFELCQVSSGGENWQSQNHVDYQGKVNLPFNGYQISVDGQSKQIVGRAQPALCATAETITIFAEVDNFWQNFPKRISANNNLLTLGLFPNQKHITYELQPGEKKTHSFFINYTDKRQQPVTVNTRPTSELVIDKEYLCATNTIPFFSTDEDDLALKQLIEQGLSGENNFFTKREVIDEFGWRNFGDLYADHEALEFKGEGQIISHYNNQYDPLYGFLRQYLATSENKWLELANDLAAHVKDIDIYHTEKDRAEYSGGLFWHTDHYLSAETASHRTYSVRQNANAYQDHAGGGGPGGQHCYTTGLMLHYFITGDESSKDAVLTLTNWIAHYYDGSGTFAEFLLALKNKNRIDLKNIVTGKYPLDRGTGHYIIALIDAFELTGKQSYLEQASMVIKSTAHPDDNIQQRDLLNVEQCWFYTVFFQAVYRFLQCKELHRQLDNSFDYARSCLLNYSTWMVKYEAPYLDKPEILEYPNHTWAAQDIRKANMLFFAAYYADNGESRRAFINKANSFYQYVTETLIDEPSRDTSRILTILMQNYGIRSFCLANNWLAPNEQKAQASTLVKQEQSSLESLLKALHETITNTNLNRELDWLRKRNAKVDNLLLKIGK